MTSAETLTRSQVARMFNVTVQTVRKWEARGRLRATPNAEGVASFSATDVEQIQRDRKVTKAGVVWPKSSPKLSMKGVRRQIKSAKEYLRITNRLISLYEEKRAAIRVVSELLRKVDSL